MTDQPASTAPLAAGLPLVQGHCPACGGSSLSLGDGGYVTCSRIDCPVPDAASTLLWLRPDSADFRQQYAAAIALYDHAVGLASDPAPRDHHYGQADAVLAVRDQELEQLRAERDRWRQRAEKRAARYEEVEAADQRVRDLHEPVQHMGQTWCGECSVRRSTGPRTEEWVAFIPHPCATINALDPQEQS